MKWLETITIPSHPNWLLYMFLIIIGMQIIGLYFTNSLEKELTDNFRKNIKQYKPNY